MYIRETSGSSRADKVEENGRCRADPRDPISCEDHARFICRSQERVESAILKIHQQKYLAPRRDNGPRKWIIRH